MHPGRGPRVALLLILLAGLALRLWYLSFGTNISRFWDEQYSIRNVRQLLGKHSFYPDAPFFPSPVFFGPPSFLLWLSGELELRTGRHEFAAFASNGDLSGVGYLIARSLQAVYGCLGLIVTFALGRRLFSREVGLVGCFVLAFTPWHIHASGYFKPDVLLTLCAALALYASIRAIEEPHPARHALAGIAIALAMSAKLTGGLTALPLVLGTLLTIKQSPLRRLALLGLAGVTSALTFLALNPHWKVYIPAFRYIQSTYDATAGASKWSVPGSAASWLASDYGLGLVGGCLAGAGLVGVALSLKRSERRAPLAMFVSFPIFYTIVYASQTSHFKGHNFVPTLPVAALAASWCALCLWQKAALRLPARARVGLGAAVLLLGMGLVSSRGLRYVYRSLTPTTEDIARVFLTAQLNPLHARIVTIQSQPEAPPEWESRRYLERVHLGIDYVADSRSRSADELDLADGEVLNASALGPDGEAFLSARRSRVPAAAVALFEPRLFELRGRKLLALAHPWRDIARPLSTSASPQPGGAEWSVAAPAELMPGDVVSAALWIPLPVLSQLPAVPEVRLGGRALMSVWTSQLDEGHLFVTQRFRVGAAQTGPLAIQARSAALGALAGEIAVDWYRWAPPASP